MSINAIKVLLINAPVFKKDHVITSVYFPMGLLYLGTVLKKNNIGVKILDISNYCNNHSFKEAQKYISETVMDYSPTIVGIGCTFSGAFKSLKLIAEGIKQLIPRTPIVIGGIHPTVFPKEILTKYKFIDFVVIGEGEETFLKLVRSISSKKKRINFDGLAYRYKGKINIIPKTKYIEDLDSLPFVDYGLVNTKNYQMNTSQWYSPKKIKVGQPFTIISSRSCPNGCTFCSMRLVHGSSIRFRSPKNVLDEMEKLYKEYNVRYFQFMDDNITFNKQRILDICRGIKERKMRIQFDTPNGMAIKLLNKEIIDALVGAGLVYTSLGIESGSEYIRNKEMKKGLRTKDIYKIIKLCAKHKKLFIKGFFIIGMPGETKKTLEETYQMIKKLTLDKIGMYFVFPYPGTELFYYCLKHKLLPHNVVDYTDIEIFQDTDDKPHIKPPNISVQELIQFREKCLDYMKQKRVSFKFPENYPLRYND